MILEDKLSEILESCLEMFDDSVETIEVEFVHSKNPLVLGFAPAFAMYYFSYPPKGYITT